MPTNYAFDVEYDPFLYSYSLTVFYPDSEDLVGEYHGLEDVDEVVDILTNKFNITVNPETIDYFNSLQCDDTIYEDDDDYFGAWE